MMRLVPKLAAPLVAAAFAFAALPAAPAAASDAAAFQLPQDYAQAAGQAAQAYHDAGMLDGVVIVADAQRVLFTGAYGQANIPFGAAYHADTKVRLASVSKPFTAALVLRLEELGLLSVEQTVGELLPEYAEAPFAAVTLDQLLSHRSGIPNYQYTAPYRAVQSRALMTGMVAAPVTAQEMITTFADRPLEFVPGENHAYSNSNYVLLQRVIEQVTGQDFAAAMQAHVFGPLGMDDSGVLDHRSVVKGLADGYTMTLQGYEAPLQAQFIGVGAPGSIYSTPGDMVRWFGALFSGRFFAQANTLEKMTTPRAKAYSETSFIGYGLYTSFVEVDGRQVRAIGHDGWGPPFTANLQYFPDSGLIVFAADGISGPGGWTYGETVRLGEDLLRIAYGAQVDPPATPPALLVTAAIRARGVDGGIAAYEEEVATGETPMPAEAELNRLGYAYLTSGESEAATATFALNVRLYPQSANALDSLAEAYGSADRWAEAAETYRRALLLDPGNARMEKALVEAEKRIP
ncbi:serine hydrolase domain-containing protein [Paraurantiacibacter namhicola]|uniref:Penicillin-binding protein 4 n=1 Tax=Paraurantiacibacter namhicola TaxID=645517 RepID=A0A1C7DAZ4_9SPHN|nr:serine hydrolase domain-containing protein [Paraurantiacibacter namhicola]ANU08656.1 Penicillin-binding protein 4* [Paraurantiacibacter namhicola]